MHSKNYNNNTNESINQYPCDHASGYCDVIAKWFGRSLEPGGRQPSGSGSVYVMMNGTHCKQWTSSTKR